MLKSEPKPELKPLPMIKEALSLPKVAEAKPSIVLAPQPKLALAEAAAPDLHQTKPSTAAVHLGDMDGITPNPNASKPATVAALGNPYGGLQGPAHEPKGTVGSAGFGNETKSGSSAGIAGKGAWFGLHVDNREIQTSSYGAGKEVAAAGMPTIGAPATPSPHTPVEAKFTPPVLLSHSEPEYTSEARQLRIQGEVVLRVTITTSGQMLVHSVIHGLGHGLDESAMRSAPTYRFQPATRNGQPVEYTTNIIIKFQTA